jgi:hypothetical protein
MKAVGLPVNEGDLNIPSGEWWVGKQLVVSLKQVPKKTKTPGGGYENEFETVPGPDGKEVRRQVITNDVTGYKPLSAIAGASPTGTTSSGGLQLA